jgi:glycolate oxidase FAD binding subunit
LEVAQRDLARGLASITARWREIEPDRDRDLAVDGVLPRLWCEPASIDELAAVVGLADRSGASILPRGGGSRMGLGGPPRSADLLLSSRRLNRVIEYEPADLTITVEAGIACAELQSCLAGEGQFLALDPPSAGQASIGGVVASNASGPLRLRYGTARDLVIGTRVVNADGVLSKAGGRVVKNVAGYDLNKLYTGSLGTLGMIVELSFKLQPIPPVEGTVLATFGALELARSAVQRVLRSPLGPLAIEALDSRTAATFLPTGIEPTSAYTIGFLVGGFEATVARASSEIGAVCREAGGTIITLDDESIRGFWSACRELPDARDPSRPLLKVAVPPARSLEALTLLQGRLAERGFTALLLAHAGSGIVYAGVNSEEWSEQALRRLAESVAEVRRSVSEWGGSLVVECCPTALKLLIDVWGEIGPSLRLMKVLKQQLDPRSTINPGRFVGGI